MVMRPKPTGSATQKKKLQEMLKKKKKDALKNKVKEKLKNKKKTKSTKTGLLSKAGLMPVSTPGGIPKVMSQKTAQKDLKPKRRPTPGKEIDRMPPELLRPKNPPRKFIPMKDGGVMDLARKLKPTGRLNTDDIRRVREMLRKGKKPVLDSKGKPVKNLTQKAGPGKPMTPEQKKQMRDFLKRMPKSAPKRQIKKEGAMPLKGAARGAMRGMRKPAGKMMRAAARRMKKTI